MSLDLRPISPGEEPIPGPPLAVPAPSPGDALLSRARRMLEGEVRAASKPIPAAALKLAERVYEQIDLLSSGVSVPPAMIPRMKLAATLWLVGSGRNAIRKRGERDEELSVSLAADEYFARHPEDEPCRRDVELCLNGLYHPDSLAERAGHREVFYDAVRTQYALPDFQDWLFLDGQSADWIAAEIETFRKIRFRTAAAQVRHSRALEHNIQELLEIRELLSGNGLVAKSRKTSLSLYRATSRNMVDMLAIADRKAGLLISANAISLSVCISLFGRGFGESPRLWAPAITIAATCALTVIFAALSSRPLKRAGGALTLEEFLAKNRSILHYGEAYRLSQEDFIRGFRRASGDPELLERGLLQELHFFSRRIVNKFRMVRWAYLTMITGILLSCGVLVVSHS